MRKVYFLGAGATKAVARAVPSTKKLLEYAFQNSGSLEVAEELRETKAFMSQVFHDRKRLPNLEDILSFIDYSIRVRPSSATHHGVEDLVRLRNNVVKIICAVLEQNLRRLDSNATEEFADKVDRDDVIISTNYDIVADNALYSGRGNIN
ncbi:MAG: hypothetical protein E3J82_03560 [Candidatus Thorarchaeota archaeon]|nr:MAG: hypothetical protein E3J82_03560 [Candidatus Thorarchaeota archaeon]